MYSLDAGGKKGKDGSELFVRKRQANIDGCTADSFDQSMIQTPLHIVSMHGVER